MWPILLPEAICMSNQLFKCVHKERSHENASAKGPREETKKTKEKFTTCPVVTCDTVSHKFMLATDFINQCEKHHVEEILNKSNVTNIKNCP